MNTYIILNKTTKIVSNTVISESLPISSSDEIILDQSNYSTEINIGSLYISDSDNFSPPLEGKYSFTTNDGYATSGADAPIGLDIDNYIFSKSLFEINYSEDLSTEISSSYFSVSNGDIINFTQNSRGCSFNLDNIDSTDDIIVGIDYRSDIIEDTHGRSFIFTQTPSSTKMNYFEQNYTGSIWN
tara:strand:- start:138 stop:692 length:555 start_codon:yes stop_codon:yes gene_type:complete